MSYIPGPWKMQEQGGVTPQGQANIGFEITAPSIPDDDYLVYLDMGTVNTNKPGADEKIAAKVATAQLIVTAPDLLEACKDAIGLIDVLLTANDEDCDRNPTYIKLRAAVAKVEKNP